MERLSKLTLMDLALSEKKLDNEWCNRIVDIATNAVQVETKSETPILEEVKKLMYDIEAALDNDDEYKAAILAHKLGILVEKLDDETQCDLELESEIEALTYKIIKYSRDKMDY